MSKVDYILNGIDQEGNIAVEVPLTPERAGEIILAEIQGGRAKVEVIPQRIGIVVGEIPARPVKAKKDKAPKAEKGEKKPGKKRQQILDLFNGGMKNADAIANRIGMTGAAVRYHLNAEGVEFEGKQTGKKVLAEPKQQEEEEEPARPDYKTVRTRELLKDGKTPLDIASELGLKIQTVNFIKAGMIKRGEIQG